MQRPFFLFILGFMVLLVPPDLWATSYSWYPYPNWAQLALVASLSGLFAYAGLSSRSLFTPIALLAMGLVGAGLAAPVIMPVMVGGESWGIAWFCISLSVPVVGCRIVRGVRGGRTSI